VGLIQRAVELLVDVAHLQQFHIGEIKQSSDIIAFAVDQQRGIPVDDGDVVQPVGEMHRQCVFDFLIGQRLALGAENLGDLFAVFRAKLMGINRIGEAFHMEDHVVFDDRRGMSLGSGIPNELQQLIDMQPRIAQERLIIVKLFTEPEKIVKRSVDGECIGDGNRAEIIDHEIDERTAGETADGERLAMAAGAERWRLVLEGAGCAPLVSNRRALGGFRYAAFGFAEIDQPSRVISKAYRAYSALNFRPPVCPQDRVAGFHEENLTPSVGQVIGVLRLAKVSDSISRRRDSTGCVMIESPRCSRLSYRGREFLAFHTIRCGISARFYRTYCSEPRMSYTTLIMLVADGNNLLINRDLSWLEFNRRVLAEAKDPRVPLLERLKFLAIFSSNLDEFFMVRVAGLKRQAKNEEAERDSDTEDPASVLAAISQKVHELTEEQHGCFLEEILPQLSAEGIHLVRPEEITEGQQRFLEEFFHKTLYPIVTPLAVDPGHPFPYLANRSLSLVVALRSIIVSPLPHSVVSIVHIPGHVVPRFIQLPAKRDQYAFILLEHVLRRYLPRLYQGFEMLSAHAIRVTRDAELGVVRRRNEDLLMSIEQGVRERRMGDAVRLQYDPDLPKDLVSQLVEELDLGSADLYAGKGFTAFTDLFQLYQSLNVPRLKDRVQVPLSFPCFERGHDPWSAIRSGDVMIFHPYQSFDAVTYFVEEAAKDPKVLAIKMTLYRVSANSPIAQALARAAESGKEVSVLVELQARFDEEANINWARALEEVGAHVVYGLIGFKTHCKLCLVVRQEADGIRRYCHLSTGNYNIRTGGIYSDLGLFTCSEQFGEDLTEVFNLLTGYTRPQRFHHVVMAPMRLREHFIRMIDRETEQAVAGRPARIIAKINSLIDRAIIGKLYHASQAGVQIDLIVRGMCSLRPGVPGLSERIRVLSIVDRYLEHARIFYFQNGDPHSFWLASSDWMPRNFDRRIEIAFPVIEPRLQTKLREILELQLAENSKGWWMQPDGAYVRANNDQADFRFQEHFYEMLQAEEESSSSSGISASAWHNCSPADFPYAFAAADSE
jgi:polyphosphate kinase